MIKAVRVEGSSMLPLFRTGEIVFYRERDRGGKPERGDCAVYSLKGILLLHRAVKKTGKGVFFSNDDGLETHFVNNESILGKIETKNPLKKGFTGLLYHKLAKNMRKLKCSLPRN